jgi:very-short-patch-repair endonuclease
MAGGSNAAFQPRSLPPLAVGRDRVGGGMSERRKDPRTGRARALRHAATPQEKRLWQALRLLEIDGHFRRQVPIGAYFADFAHFGAKLIVEIDGGQHGFAAQQQYDEARTGLLARAGFRVLRFWNHEVSDNLEGVVETILHALAQANPPTPSPSPPQAGGGESARTAAEAPKEIS